MLVLVVKHFLFLQYFLGELQALLDAAVVPVAHELLNGMLVVGGHELLVELQGFLLGFLRGIGHVARRWLLHSKNLAVLPSLQEYFLEWASAFLVVQTVDGEDFLAVVVGEGEGGLDVIELVLELALV